MSDMPNMPGWAWARVSTLAQDERAQLPDIQKYAHKEGIDLLHTVTVAGESAFHGDQEPDLRRVIEAARRGEFKVLVSWLAVDRVERRGTRFALRFLLDLEDAGAQWHITGHGRVTVDDLQGLIKLGLGAQQAHDESKLKSERARIHHDQIEAAVWPDGKTWAPMVEVVPGAWKYPDRLGAFRGNTPFGYMSVKFGGYKWLVPHPVESKLVQEGFERVLDGWSTKAIAEWWTATPGRRRIGDALEAKPKGATLVCRVLHNTSLYALGLYSVVKEQKAADGTREVVGTYVHEVQPLVDFEIAKRVLEVLASRQGGGPRNRRPDHADYSGLLKCGSCGQGPMYRSFGSTVKWRAKGNVCRSYVCKACKKCIHADAADAEITRIMSTDPARAYRRIWIPGVSAEAERRKIGMEISQIGQRGLPVPEMIAELQRLQAAQEAIQEDVKGHWVLADLNISQGDLFVIQPDHPSRLLMCRGWEWTGLRGPRPGTVVIERLPKDGAGLTSGNTELLMRSVEAQSPGFLYQAGEAVA